MKTRGFSVYPRLKNTLHLFYRNCSLPIRVANVAPTVPMPGSARPPTSSDVATLEPKVPMPGATAPTTIVADPTTPVPSSNAVAAAISGVWRRLRTHPKPRSFADAEVDRRAAPLGRRHRRYVEERDAEATTAVE